MLMIVVVLLSIIGITIGYKCDRYSSIISYNKNGMKSIALNYKKANRYNDNDDAIDPMDVIDNDKKLKQSNSDNDRIKQVNIIDSPRQKMNDKDVEMMLLQQEANILQTLPTNLLIVFNNLMEQIVWRFAFVCVTSHVMLLIPVLRYVKLTLGMSIIPFIYIFPILFILPFIVYGLWDTNTAKISYIDELLLSFLKNQQGLAKLNIQEQTTKFQNLVLYNNVEQESVKYLAYVRLFTRINPEVLRDEILALKEKSSGKILTILSTSAESSNVDLDSFPINNNNNMDVVNAAQTIIKVVSATGQDKRDTLNDLKELQDVLLKINNKEIHQNEQK